MGYLAVMVRWLGSTLHTRRELALENLALRQHLAAWKARQPRPRPTEMDRSSGFVFTGWES